jgi:hypothetical protein
MEPNQTNIMRKLLELQGALKVDKTHYNSFGDYNYRSKEDILEAIKPLAHERDCVVICEDEIVFVADGWVYVKTTAKLVDVETGELVTASGYAREPESKPKMDSSQTTGSASSYAGKRALGNLFAIDDTADSDALNQPVNTPPSNQPFIGACSACGMQYQFESADQMARSQCQCGNRQFLVV